MVLRIGLEFDSDDEEMVGGTWILPRPCLQGSGNEGQVIALRTRKATEFAEQMRQEKCQLRITVSLKVFSSYQTVGIKEKNGNRNLQGSCGNISQRQLATSPKQGHPSFCYLFIHDTHTQALDFTCGDYSSSCKAVTDTALCYSKEIDIFCILPDVLGSGESSSN